MRTPTINDGGPAFPTPTVELPNDLIMLGSNGMSLRDWFAGQALTGIIANSTHIGAEDAENWSFQFADAMIAARNNPPIPHP